MVHSVGDNVLGQQSAPQIPFSEESLSVVRAGLNKVTNEPGGTAYAWRINEPGLEMAGKTGTAQVRRFSREERARGLTSNQNLAWKLRDHALFVGYAPYINPRYALSIIIEHGAVGHPHVEMARDILTFAQKRDVIARPTAYPVKAAAAPGTTRGAQNQARPQAKEPG
jgi:penicillin-binding protein 2